MTSPPEESSAISWTCHNGKPVSRSTLGWPESNANRCSGDRVHTNVTPAVSILSFIVLFSCICFCGLIHGRLRPHSQNTSQPHARVREKE
jgi:hypothetical protein